MRLAPATYEQTETSKGTTSGWACSVQMLATIAPMYLRKMRLLTVHFAQNLVKVAV